MKRHRESSGKTKQNKKVNPRIKLSGLHWGNCASPSFLFLQRTKYMIRTRAMALGLE